MKRGHIEDGPWTIGTIGATQCVKFAVCAYLLPFLKGRDGLQGSSRVTAQARTSCSEGKNSSLVKGFLPGGSFQEVGLWDGFLSEGSCKKHLFYCCTVRKRKTGRSLKFISAHAYSRDKVLFQG